MATFYDKLAYVMGGEGNITPEFRQTFADYNNFTAQQANFNPFSVAFTGSPSSVSVGQNTGGGLYGPTVKFTPGENALNAVNPSAYANDKKEGAQRLSADVIRAQYQDYQNRFAPIENFAVQSLTRNGTMDGQFDVARSRAAVENAGANLQGQQERAMGRFGLGATSPNIAQSNEVTGGVVAGMNQARLADADRRLQMLGGGAGAGAAGTRG